jgi:hypothetical protein
MIKILQVDEFSLLTSYQDKALFPLPLPFLQHSLIHGCGSFDANTHWMEVTFNKLTSA